MIMDDHECWDVGENANGGGRVHCNSCSRVYGRGDWTFNWDEGSYWSPKLMNGVEGVATTIRFYQFSIGKFDSKLEGEYVFCVRYTKQELSIFE